MKSILTEIGKKYGAQCASRILFIGMTVALCLASIYLLAVVLIRPLPFHPTIALVGPLLAFLCVSIYALREKRRLSMPRSIARELESQNPNMALKIRSALDFLDGKSDVKTEPLLDLYVDGIRHQLDHAQVVARRWQRWALAALGAALCVLITWHGFEPVFLSKLNSTGMNFGTLELHLDGGTISIFEPAYTAIPGRTMPMEPGTYQAYPGSRIRFSVPTKATLRKLFFQTGVMQEPQEMAKTGQGNFSCELLLIEPVEVRFLVSEKGRTAPYNFAPKTDHPPQIQLKSYTSEGVVSTYDPLFMDAVVRDDFSISSLDVVAEWEGDSRRLTLPIPNHQRNHFLSRNRWSLSELVDPNASHFSLYLEARDNNPIGDGGVARSRRLEFELENPEQVHRDFIDLARQLLDQMTHSMGDNLDTHLQSPHETYYFDKARLLSNQIQTGLMHAQNITNTLLDLLAQDPHGTALDQDFLRTFRKDLIAAYQFRMHMGQLYASARSSTRTARSFSALQNLHGKEEIRLEKLTYDLLLQLKMWAMLEMERKKNEIDDALDMLNDLIDNAENMDVDELEKKASQLLDELMKKFNELMAKAAQEMDRSMEEFMNMEGMENQTDMMEQIQEQLLDALKSGDMQQVKKLLEQLEQMMMNAMNQMQQAMGELSPEMQAMMQEMREMMGLLRELKTQEEELEANTQELRKQIDEEMGGNPTDMDPAQQAEQIKIMDHIKQLLQTLHENLVFFQEEDTYRELVDSIAKMKNKMIDENTTEPEKRELRNDIANLERTLDFVLNNSLDRLQEITLRSLDSADEMQDFLDQAEYRHSLELGLKLESLLMQGEMMSERGVAEQVREKANPAETFKTARDELFHILEALQNLRQNAEKQRQNHMQKSGEKRQKKLSQRQQKIEQMIDEFECRSQDGLGGSQLMDKLDGISRSMKNARHRLDNSKLDSAAFFEQEALRKIGEMLEQMQQTLQPGPSVPQFRFSMGERRIGMTGDPTGDVFIPQSEFEMTEDQLKNAIRKQLQKNPPDAFGKEIRKYYDTLMDQ